MCILVTLSALCDRSAIKGRFHCIVFLFFAENQFTSGFASGVILIPRTSWTGTFWDSPICRWVGRAVLKSWLRPWFRTILPSVFVVHTSIGITTCFFCFVFFSFLSFFLFFNALQNLLPHTSPVLVYLFSRFISTTFTRQWKSQQIIRKNRTCEGATYPSCKENWYRTWLLTLTNGHRAKKREPSFSRYVNSTCRCKGAIKGVCMRGRGWRSPTQAPQCSFFAHLRMQILGVCC